MLGKKEAAMDRPSRSTSRPSRGLRRWVVRVGIATVILEGLYLIVGNLSLRTGVLEKMINDRPEENFVSWESGATYLPGFVSLKGLSYRGQSMSGQVYVHLPEVDARISLTQLVLKRLRIRSAVGSDVDYRYRERIDYPCWSEAGGEPFPGVPANVEDFPEIPGLQNPPNPRPEELYSQEPETRPWTVEISDARIEGAVHAAYNGIRVDGEGSVEGGMTVILDESYAIDGATVRLAPATLQSGSRVVTDDLDLDLDIRVNPFSGGCAELADVIGGISGSMVFAGRDSSGFTMDVAALDSLLPGQGVFSIESGSGRLGGALEVTDGSLVSGDLDLVSDDVVITYQHVPLQGDLEVHGSLREMDLAARQFDITGSTFRLDDVTATGSTPKEREKLEPWYGHLEFEEGVVTFGRPMELDSRVRLKMHDTRPVLILLRKFTDKVNWLSLTRNARGIEATMDLDFGDGFVAFNDLRLTGEDVEILGWVYVRNQVKNGRIYARHGRRAAGMAFDGGDGKVVLIEPRKWFDQQEGRPSSGTLETVPEER
jgi:hypothetical protein